MINHGPGWVRLVPGAPGSPIRAAKRFLLEVYIVNNQPQSRKGQGWYLVHPGRRSELRDDISWKFSLQLIDSGPGIYLVDGDDFILMVCPMQVN